MLKNETITSEWQLEQCEKLQNMMKNLYIIASFAGHVSGTDVDSNRPGKRRIRKILYGADCDAIWNNLWQKIPDQVFSATVSPEGGFKLCKYSLPATTGVLQHQGLMETADGAIRSRWTLILVNVQKLANNYPALRSTGSNHKSNFKQREDDLCNLQTPAAVSKNLLQKDFCWTFVGKTRGPFDCGGWRLLSKICTLSKQ